MPPHVGVFPFPFASHLFSMLSLAHKLVHAAPNIQFSFFNTSKSNNSLFGFASKAKLEHNIILYDVEDGVPIGHVFSENPRKPVELFLKATPESFKRAMDMATSERGSNISCLISNALLCALLKVLVDGLRIPWINIWSASPCALSGFIYADLIRKEMANDCLSIQLYFLLGLSEMRISDMCEEVLSDDLQELVFCQALRRIGDLLPRATTIVINCNREITPTFLTNDLESKFQKLLYVGFPTISFPPPPLPPSDSDHTGCFSWLDGQKERLVVYITFGTEDITLLESEIVALVEVLEENNIPFLWSIKDNFKKLFPNGFVERTSLHGKVVPWAP